MELKKDIIDVCIYGLNCIVGGAVVATYSWSTNVYTNAIIGIEYFQDGFYRKRRHRKEIIKEITRLLKNHKAKPKRTGKLRFYNIGNEDIEAIAREFPQYETAIVSYDGLIEEYAKVIFDTYLYLINVPLNVRGTKDLISWVSKSYDTRVAYVKTGWSIWKNKYHPRLLLTIEKKSTNKDSLRSLRQKLREP